MQQLSLFRLAEAKPVEEKAGQKEVPAIGGSTAVEDSSNEPEELQENGSDITSKIKDDEVKVKSAFEDESVIVFEDANIAVEVEKTNAETNLEIIEQAETSLSKESDDATVFERVTSNGFTAAPPVIKKRGRKSFKEMDAEVDLIEIPEDEVLFQKQYYPMRVVAGWFRVNSSLLRYWETEFDILKPRKNRKGDRLFRPEDVKNLQLIYYLLRRRKFTIEGAKKYLKANRKNADINLQLVQSLTKFRGFLLELKANLGT